MHKDYSGTPLYKKLGIKPGHHVAWSGAPDHFERLLAPLPTGVTVRKALRGRLNVVVLFADRSSGLRRRFEAAARAIEFDGGLWVAYPKKSSAMATDVTFEIVQGAGLEAGLVDNKVAAIDGDWTAVRFVYRLEDRK
jgi:hypothetical protein